MRRFFFFLIAILAIGSIMLIGIPKLAEQSYGRPSDRLNPLQIFQYSTKILWDDGLLTHPVDPSGLEHTFTVQENESVTSIARDLHREGLISDASIFRDYLIYTGLDNTIQAGDYQLSKAMSIIDIAHKMQDATPADTTFVILPGWRMEEIALSLPTSGLNITPDAFMKAASSAPSGFDFLTDATSMEGFFYPDTYILPRNTTVDQLINTLLQNFSQHLSISMREGYARQGLSIYQAVILASIVQREAVQADEAPLIASVYLNRLKIQMKLDADPTVQYALGYNPVQQTWWTNPLSAEDLKSTSPFNTYLSDGLPPTPIDSPSLSSLEAVASPADTTYYYFSARCDASGYHNFAQTFDEHLQNLCP